MTCPNCASTATSERPTRTQLGYRTFRCLRCRRTFNERSGTPFNYLTFPSDIILQVVLWRLRYKLSLRDLAEMFLERGFVFTHEAVRAWEARFAPLLADKLRAKRKAQSAARGTLMRPISRSLVRGAMCTEPSTEMAIWSTRC